MLSYDDAFERIISQITALPAEECPIAESLGRALAEAVTAPAPIPPFRNSSMDGYAIRYADLAANAPLRIVETVRAGMASTHTVGPGEAAPIMTGAIVPGGADTVVPIEDAFPEGSSTRPRGPSPLPLPEAGRGALDTKADTHTQMSSLGAPATNEDISPSGKESSSNSSPAGSDYSHGGRLTITGSVERGQCIREAGEDVAEGAVVAPAGVSIGPGAVGMFAAVGRTTVMTHRRPRVAIITSGDELVTPGTPLAPGQIYNSNGFLLAAQVRDAGGSVVATIHAADTPDALREALDAVASANADVLISTGGVSVGAYDYVKDVVAERGMLDFWGVAIRPGKPVAYGRCQGAVYFGLPGNPASTMVTFELFVRPVLRRMLGHAVIQRPRLSVRLLEDVAHPPGRRTFMRATVTRGAGSSSNEYVASLAGGQGSGMLHAAVSANALLIVPEDRSLIAAGDISEAIVIDPSTL